MSDTARTLWAVSDLHAAIKENRDVVKHLAPGHAGDWLIVAGDVAERPELVLRVLGELAARYARVIYTPGNHELFCRGTDRHRGEDRYAQLIEGARELGITTPEDPYPTFAGHTICPLFTLYDYSWRPAGLTADQAIDAAAKRGVQLVDETFLRPFADTPEWCARRLAVTSRRLADTEGPTVLINHWPLVEQACESLEIPDIALWSGTRHTQDWPTRYRAVTVVYGHLHIPGAFTLDGVTHVDVGLGYPREWRARKPEPWPYPVLEER